MDSPTGEWSPWRSVRARVIVDRVHPQITILTSVQKGLITRAQLTQIGLNRHNVAHLVNAGRLVRVTPRLLMLRGTPVDDHVEALGATLDAQGVLSHQSAAALWGVPGYSLKPVHVTRDRGGRVRPTHVARVHACRLLDLDHITKYQEIPVLRPGRVLFDLAATEHPARLTRSLDWMWSRRLVTVESLDRIVSELPGQGRKGHGLIRELIEERRGLAPIGSGLESRFDVIVSAAGLPPFKRQLDLGDDQQWIGRVDFASTVKLLVVEIDSELHHAALSDLEHDAQRRERLERAGFMVRELSEHELFHRRAHTIDLLRQWYREAPSR